MKEFFSLVSRLNTLKNEMGFEQDLLTPGFIKEILMGSKLNHYVHRTKHGPDAYSDSTESVSYEYLTCKKGGTFQLDRIHEGMICSILVRLIKKMELVLKKFMKLKRIKY